VHDESALERDTSVYGLYPLVGSEVLTESGEFLGRVRALFSLPLWRLPERNTYCNSTMQLRETPHEVYMCIRKFTPIL
jgi:hypothetical protein